MVAWPSSSWIARRSAPPPADGSRTSGAACAASHPARCPRAGPRRAAAAARSEVPSRRPLFDRNMARLGAASPSRASSGRPRSRYAFERAPGRLADRDDARPCRPSRARAAPRRRSPRRPCRGVTTPPRAARSRMRARTSRGRAARAASLPGSSRAAPRPRPSFSTRGRYCVPLRVTSRGRPGSPRARRCRPGGGRTSGSTRACARRSTSTRRARTGRRRSGAGACGRRSSGARPCAPPTRRAGDVGEVGAPRLLRGTAAAAASAPRSPSAAPHLAWSSMSVFWVNYEDGRVATRDQLAEAGPRRRRRARPSARGIRSRARATRRRCGTPCCASGSAGSS